METGPGYELEAAFAAAPEAAEKAIPAVKEVIRSRLDNSILFSPFRAPLLFTFARRQFFTILRRFKLFCLGTPSNESGTFYLAWIPASTTIAFEVSLTCPIPAGHDRRKRVDSSRSMRHGRPRASGTTAHLRACQQAAVDCVP
jgi:hypothetical protein